MTERSDIARTQNQRYVADIADRTPGLALLERTVNGQPGLVAQQDGVTVTVFAFDVAGDQIKHIWAVPTPTSSGPGRRADPRLPTTGPLPSADARRQQHARH